MRPASSRVKAGTDLAALLDLQGAGRSKSFTRPEKCSANRGVGPEYGYYPPAGHNDLPMTAR